MTTPPPDVLWREDFCFFAYGAVKSVCIGAWVCFMLIPGLFFGLVAPGLLDQLGPPLVLTSLSLYALAAACFVCTSCWNPGVPKRPPVAPANARVMVQHPGDEYTLSRDTNRYVRRFDHFCEFVGNDIGEQNMFCFVGLLVSLALLSTVLLASCMIALAVMWFGRSPMHFASEPLQYVLSGIALLLVVVLVRRCWASDTCAGTMPLVMMMPGASAGVGLLFLLLVVVVELPMISDMWAASSWQRNPAPLYLMLPFLAFMVLFCGMSAHWIFLLGSGVSQKLWLRAKGLRFKRNTEHELV